MGRKRKGVSHKKQSKKAKLAHDESTEASLHNSDDKSELQHTQNQGNDNGAQQEDLQPTPGTSNSDDQSSSISQKPYIIEKIRERKVRKFHVEELTFRANLKFTKFITI